MHTAVVLIFINTGYVLYANLVSTNEIFQSRKKHREGLWQLYTKSGNFGKLIAATVLSAIRGMELPAHALIFKFSFNGFASDDENVMMRELLNVFIAYIALGFACLIALFSAVYLLTVFIFVLIVIQLSFLYLYQLCLAQCS